MGGGLFGEATLYTTFFPEYEAYFLKVLAQNCTPVLEEYRRDGRGLGNGVCYPVFNCIMENSSEGTKASMAASAILLGLMPVVLSCLGNSATEMALLALNRPFLSLLIAFGAPLSVPMRAFDLPDPILSLRQNDSNPGRPKAAPKRTVALVSTIELAFVLAAIVNVVQVSWQIGYKAVGVFLSCNFRYGALIWTLAGSGIHVVSGIAIRSRGHVLRPGSEPGSAVWSSIEHVLTPSKYRQQARLDLRPATTMYQIMQLVISILIMLHTIYGTAYFSALYLIAVPDAIMIVTRFAASTIVCRSVLMYELSGMAETLGLEEHEP